MHIKKPLVTGFLCFSLLSCIYAQSTFTWVGTTSTDWRVGSNWQGGKAPRIVNGLVNDYLNINVTGTGYYPTFDNISIGRAQGSKLGSITVAPGAQLTITSGLTIASGLGSLTIQSNSSADGLLMFDAGTQSGNSTVELFLTGGLNGSLARFHYFVPPVQSMSIGTVPTIAETQTALGLTNFAGDLVRYNEPSAVSSKLEGWQYFDNYPGSPPGFTTLTPAQGYNIYFTANDKITFSGLLNAAEHTFNLSYSSGNAGAGWNLLGNPYPCNYNLNGIAGLGTIVPGISNTVYYTTNGGYEYWNVYTKTGSSGGYSDILPPMTGFFALVSETGHSLTLPVASKTFSASDSRSLHKGDAPPKGLIVKKIKLSLASNEDKDETIVCIFDDATESFNEHYDAYKLFGTITSKPFIYSRLNGIDYFMKAVAGPDHSPVEVPLELVMRESGTHTISVTEFDNLQGIEVKLMHGSIEVPLDTGSVYTFYSDAGTCSDFLLVFNNSLTGIDDIEITAPKTWYNNKYFYINSPETISTTKGSLLIYDFKGRAVYINNKVDIIPGNMIQIPLDLTNGFYITEIVIERVRYMSRILIF